MVKINKDSRYENHLLDAWLKLVSDVGISPLNESMLMDMYLRVACMQKLGGNAIKVVPLGGDFFIWRVK